MSRFRAFSCSAPDSGTAAPRVTAMTMLSADEFDNARREHGDTAPM